jgi:hypothetical protein
MRSEAFIRGRLTAVCALGQGQIGGGRPGNAVRAGGIPKSGSSTTARGMGALLDWALLAGGVAGLVAALQAEENRLRYTATALAVVIGSILLLLSRHNKPKKKPPQSTVMRRLNSDALDGSATSPGRDDRLDETTVSGATRYADASLGEVIFDKLAAYQKQNIRPGTTLGTLRGASKSHEARNIQASPNASTTWNTALPVKLWRTGHHPPITACGQARGSSG